MSSSNLAANTFDLAPEHLEAALDDGPCIVRLETELSTAVQPLDAYTTLADTNGSSAGGRDHRFLLESAAKADSSDPGSAYAAGSGADDRARFSFLGYDPDTRIEVDSRECRVTTLDDEPLGDPFDVTTPADAGPIEHLRAATPTARLVNFGSEDRHRLDGGLVGFLAYETVYDQWLDDAGFERPATDTPEAVFVMSRKTLVFDHLADTCSVVLTPYVTPGTDPAELIEAAIGEVERLETRLDGVPVEPSRGPFNVDADREVDRAAFESMVEAVKTRIRDGEVYQTVVARTRELEGTFDPSTLYSVLRERNPSPYMYLLEFDDLGIVGASPETLVTVTGGDDRPTVMANPIAGTAPRGGAPAADAPDPVEDRRLAGELLADPKERAEHTMLVDLGRNDLRRICTGGTVDVAEFMAVRKYSHVQHIESEVVGTLAADADRFDAIASLFPAGTLTGAPKRRAMELIHEIEAAPRGVYGGGVGYVSWDGDVDLAIAIRTATIHRGDVDVLRARAGAGVVAASDPAREFEETEAKLGGVLGAIDTLTAGDEEVPAADD